MQVILTECVSWIILVTREIKLNSQYGYYSAPGGFSGKVHKK